MCDRERTNFFFFFSTRSTTLRQATKFTIKHFRNVTLWYNFRDSLHGASKTTTRLIKPKFLLLTPRVIENKRKLEGSDRVSIHARIEIRTVTTVGGVWHDALHANAPRSVTRTPPFDLRGFDYGHHHHVNCRSFVAAVYTSEFDSQVNIFQCCVINYARLTLEKCELNDLFFFVKLWYLITQKGCVFPNQVL